MGALLRFACFIDKLNRWIGRGFAWLILVAVVVSATNATVRKVFDVSSNCLARIAMGAVLRRLSAMRGMDAARQRARPHRHREQPAAEAAAQHHRTHRPRFFPAAAHYHHGRDRRSFLHSLLRDQRTVRQCRRAAAMAGKVADHDRLCNAACAGHFRADQAHRRSCAASFRIRMRRRPMPSKPKSNTSSRRWKSPERSSRPGGENGSFYHSQHGADHVRLRWCCFCCSAIRRRFRWPPSDCFSRFIGIGLGQFQPDFLQALPERVYGVMSNDTLLAIPFFTFMGLVLERSGMAEDLLDTIGQLFGTRARRPRLCGRSSSARCWPPRPAWSPPRSSRWD